MTFPILHAIYVFILFNYKFEKYQLKMVLKIGLWMIQVYSEAINAKSSAIYTLNYFWDFHLEIVNTKIDSFFNIYVPKVLEMQIVYLKRIKKSKFSFSF